MCRHRRQLPRRRRRFRGTRRALQDSHGPRQGCPRRSRGRSRSRRSGRRSTSRDRRRARRAEPPCAVRRRAAGSARRARRLSVSSSPAAGSSSMMTDGPDATARDADQAAASVRQLVGGLVEVRLELELVDRRDRGRRQLVAAGPEQIGQPRHGRGGVGAGADVLLDADVVEQLERLERATQSAAGSLRRRPSRDRTVVDGSSAPAPATKPVTASMIVVLPAPFGPMSPTTSPGCTSKLTSSTATTPPKRTVRSATVSVAGGTGSGASGRSGASSRAARSGAVEGRSVAARA